MSRNYSIAAGVARILYVKHLGNWEAVAREMTHPDGTPYTAHAVRVAVWKASKRKDHERHKRESDYGRVYRRIFALLRRRGFRDDSAFRLVVDAKRGDRWAVRSIRAVRRGLKLDGRRGLP